MTRLQLFLVGVIIAQVFGVFTALNRPKLAKVAPPLPELKRVDSISATEIASIHELCDPTSADDLANLSEMYFTQGFYPEAAACLQRACELAPSDADFRFDYAFCLAHAGRVEDAIAAYEQVVEMGGKNVKAAQYFLGRCRLRMNQPDEAKVVFQGIGDMPAADFEMSRMHMRRSEFQQAGRLLQRLCSGNSDAAEYWYWASRASDSMGEPTKALRQADRASNAFSRGDTPFNEQSERWYQVLEAYGISRVRLGVQKRLAADQIEGLRDLAEDALAAEWYPEGEDALAEIDLQQGDSKSAIKRLQRILDRAGPSLDRYWRLGDAYAMDNQPDKAEEAWYRGVKLGRGKYNDLAGLHEALGEWHEKNRNDVQAAERHRTKALRYQGISHFESREYRDAITALQLTIERDATQPQAWFYLGEARRLSTSASPAAPGETAADAYRRCLELAPHHGRAAAALRLVEATN